MNYFPFVNFTTAYKFTLCIVLLLTGIVNSQGFSLFKDRIKETRHIKQH